MRVGMWRQAAEAYEFFTRTSKPTTPMAEHQKKDSSPAVAEVAARAACETQDDKNQHRPRLSSKLPAATSSTKPPLESLLEKLNHDLKEQHKKYTILVRCYNHLLKESNERVGLVNELQNRSNFYKEVIDTMLHHCIEPYATQQGYLPKEWTEAAVSRVVTPLCHDAMEAASLRAQLKVTQNDLHVAKDEVQILQKDMLAKVEKVNATTDEEFAQEFRNLVSSVRTLSREIRITGFDIPIDAFSSCVTIAGIPPHLWQTRVLKKYLLESWFWSVLIDNIFSSPFVVFGKRCDGLSNNWRQLYGSARSIEWPCPTPLSETWRCTTVKQIVSIDEQDACPERRLGDQHKGIHEDVVELREGIINALVTGLKPGTSTTHLPKMYQIIDKARELSTQMSVQRARLQVTFPSIGGTFDSSAMSAVPGPDGEDIETGHVNFTIHPGLTKWGDAHGKNLDQRYDIVHALVNVEPAGSVQEASIR